MNYIKIYNQFIESFKNQVIEEGVYTEKHHVIPRHAGGSDDSDNLLVLTFRQHRFLHKLRYKAFGERGDQIAYKMMYASEGWIRKKNGTVAGARNVESGLLDEIRHLANNEVQRRKASETGKRHIETGHMARMQVLAMAKRKENKKKRMDAKRKRVDDKYQDSPEKLSKYQSWRGKTIEERQVILEKEASDVIENALRVEEYLHKTSTRTKYLIISPEGLVFESRDFAAGYYGNIDPERIGNWSRRKMHGWDYVPKPERG